MSTTPLTSRSLADMNDGNPFDRDEVASFTPTTRHNGDLRHVSATPTWHYKALKCISLCAGAWGICRGINDQNALLGLGGAAGVALGTFFHRAEIDLLKAHANIKNLESDNQKLSDEIIRQAKRLDDFQQDYETLERENQELRDEITQTAEELNGLPQDWSDLKEKNQQLLEALEKSEHEWLKKDNKYLAAKGRHQKEIAGLNLVIDALKTALEQSRTQNSRQNQSTPSPKTEPKERPDQTFAPSTPPSTRRSQSTPPDLKESSNNGSHPMPRLYWRRSPPNLSQKKPVL